MTPSRCLRCGDFRRVYLGGGVFVPCPRCVLPHVEYTYQPTTAATTGPAVPDHRRGP